MEKKLSKLSKKEFVALSKEEYEYLWEQHKIEI